MSRVLVFIMVCPTFSSLELMVLISLKKTDTEMIPMSHSFLVTALTQDSLSLLDGSRRRATLVSKVFISEVVEISGGPEDDDKA